MNVFGIGPLEMAIILIVALLVFGPKKLPEIGRSLGKTVRGFQEASKEFTNEFKKESQQVEESVQMQATLESGTPPSNVAETSESVQTSYSRQQEEKA
jgi:sec-independent protein translocase protein TatA